MNHELSAREAQVLGLMAEGLGDKLIARRLELSLGTVKGYNRTLYAKLGAMNRAHAFGLGLELLPGHSHDPGQSDPVERQDCEPTRGSDSLEARGTNPEGEESV